MEIGDRRCVCFPPVSDLRSPISDLRPPPSPMDGMSESAAARVLLVEDDRRIAEVIALYLRHAGHRVFVEHDGAAALQRIAAERFDLLMLDRMLPGADGLHGRDGRDGVDGKDGRDGVDGRHGTDGRNGERGLRGVAAPFVSRAEFRRVERRTTA